jgi:hypothetical protein
MMAVSVMSPTWTRTFRGGDPAQIGVIRGWVRALVPDALAWPVALTATELATNALLHTRSGQPGGNIAVSVRTDPDGAIRLAVTDNGTPTPTDAQADNQTGAHSDKTGGTATGPGSGAGAGSEPRPGDDRLPAGVPGEDETSAGGGSAAAPGSGPSEGRVREGGRGLSIVDAYAAEWGISGDEDGHTSWAIVTHRPPATLPNGGGAAAQPGRAAAGH